MVCPEDNPGQFLWGRLMARIRTIKPELFSDEKLTPMDPTTRFVFVGLICLADDGGRLLDNVRLVDSLLFLMTNDSSRDALATLSRSGLIQRGKTASGQAVIQITNWSKHQRVDHPNFKAALPELVTVEQVAGVPELLASDSRDIRAAFAPRPTTYDLRPATDDRRPSASSSSKRERLLAKVDLEAPQLNLPGM